MLSVGLNVVNFGPAGDARSVGDTILRAEASGFDLAMVSDHVAVTPDVNQSYPAPFLEAFTLLSWVSTMTTDIALGTTVAVLPYRYPLLVAAMADTIERLSGRRFVLGVGAGWAKQEYQALQALAGARCGLRRARPHHRGLPRSARRATQYLRSRGSLRLVHRRCLRSVRRRHLGGWQQPAGPQAPTDASYRQIYIAVTAAIVVWLGFRPPVKTLDDRPI